MKSIRSLRDVAMSLDKPIDNIDYPVESGIPEYRVEAILRRASEQRLFLPLKPFLLGINVIEIQEDGDFPSHEHSDYELILTQQSSYSCRLNGQRVEISDEQGLLIKPGDLHEVSFKKGQSYTILAFRILESQSEQPAKLELLDKSVTPKQQVFEAPKSSFAPIIELIGQHAGNRERFAAQIQDSLLQQAFWLMLSSFSEEALSNSFRRQSHEQRFVKELLHALDENLEERPSVDDLANQLNISKSTLTKHCRTMLGDTPAQLVMRSKARHAAVLLSRSNLSVKEVSFQLGFNNPYHFSRVFKKYNGYPPSQAQKGEAV